jgi:hypothetical protein
VVSLRVSSLAHYVLLTVLACTVGPVAFAHGGVAVEDDTCIMTIGTYKAHFTGYQPQVRASQEFCEDIPAVAKSIIVLDFISRPLRDMLIDFRVVKDVNDVGVTATIDDLGSAGDIDRATVFRRPPERFPRGSVDVTLEFTEPGQYIGIMTAIDETTDVRREYVSVFPFSVGVTNWWARFKWIIASLVLGAVLLFWTTRTRDSTTPAS